MIQSVSCLKLDMNLRTVGICFESYFTFNFKNVRKGWNLKTRVYLSCGAVMTAAKTPLIQHIVIPFFTIFSALLFFPQSCYISCAEGQVRALLS